MRDSRSGFFSGSWAIVYYEDGVHEGLGDLGVFGGTRRTGTYVDWPSQCGVSNMERVR